MFAKHFPNVNWWVYSHGWIQLGGDGYENDSWVTLLDEGGTCWTDEGGGSLDEALLNAEKWLAIEIVDRFGETPPKTYED